MTVAGIRVEPSMTHGRRYVFVSHARSDNLLVESFVADLDVDLWADPDHYDDASAEKILETAITNSAAFVVLMTRVSIRRPWVRWEVRTALALGQLPIVPVYWDIRLDRVPEPFDALLRYRPVRLPESAAAIQRVLASDSLAVDST
jgi:hypothetical protein